MNINKSFINNLRFDGAEKTYFDDSLKGFGVRVRKDSASYIVMYRNAYGKQKKMTVLPPNCQAEKARGFELISTCAGDLYSKAECK